MSTISDTEDDRLHMVMNGVSWSYYERTLKEIGNQPIRVAYLDGVMELMSPLPEHEGHKKAIASLILVLAMECEISLRSFGSTTFRRKAKAAGSEPDESFYFREVESVRQMKRFDPAVHRAPDLWIEVDILTPSVPREPIYARLGVPEVWRYSHDQLTVRMLTPDGVYADSPSSSAFPFLPMLEFADFIRRTIEGDELKTLLEFRKWVGKLPR